MPPDGAQQRRTSNSYGAGGTNTGSSGANDVYPIKDFAELTKRNTLANQAKNDGLPGNIAGSGRGPSKIKSFLATGGVAGLGQEVGGASEPIADTFANCTVLFADIAGFTAWSSERDPPQVFKLLETVYGAFDEMADKLKVGNRTPFGLGAFWKFAEENLSLTIYVFVAVRTGFQSRNDRRLLYGRYRVARAR